MALVLITHDMGVVAETADRVIVQYNGRKMEDTDVALAVRAAGEPLHPRAALRAARERQGRAAADRLRLSRPGTHSERRARSSRRAASPATTSRGGLFGGKRVVQALKGIDLKVDRGKTLAVVGEFGLRQVHPGPDHHHDRPAHRR